jgi:glucoamylase
MDEVIDISLLGLATLGEFNPKDPRIVETADTIQKELWIDSPIGGCARYRNDQYYRQKDCPADIPGNPWFISALWLAEYFILPSKSRSALCASFVARINSSS